MLCLYYINLQNIISNIFKIPEDNLVLTKSTKLEIKVLKQKGLRIINCDIKIAVITMSVIYQGPVEICILIHLILKTNLRT